MIRRLTSGAEARVARAPVQGAQVARRVLAQPVAHAVVAGEVARRLGGRDEVVGRHGVRQVTAAARRRAARPRARASCSAPRSAPSCPARRPAPEARAARRRAGRSRSPASPCSNAGTATGGAGGVVRVAAAQGGADERGVLDAARERPDLVERGGERDEAVAADAAVGRLEADDAAEARPAAGSSRRCRCRARAGPCRAATAAAEPPEEPPGTRAGSHGLRVGLNALCSVDEPIANSSMFVLPTITRAGGLEARDGRGGERRAVALEDARAAGRREALDVEHVLDGDRHAGERRRRGSPAASSRSSARARASARSASDGQEGVDGGLDGGDAVEVRARDLLAGDLARGDAARGSRPRASSCSGAVTDHPRHAEQPVRRVRAPRSSARARPTPSRGSSARHSGASAWAMGGTALTSRACSDSAQARISSSCAREQRRAPRRQRQAREARHVLHRLQRSPWAWAATLYCRAGRPHDEEATHGALPGSVSNAAARDAAGRRRVPELWRAVDVRPRRLARRAACGARSPPSAALPSRPPAATVRRRRATLAREPAATPWEERDRPRPAHRARRDDAPGARRRPTALLPGDAGERRHRRRRCSTP